MKLTLFLLVVVIILVRLHILLKAMNIIQLSCCCG